METFSDKKQIRTTNLSPMKSIQPITNPPLTSVKKDKLISSSDEDNSEEPQTIVKVRKKLVKNPSAAPKKNSVHTKMYLKPWSIISDPALSYNDSVSLHDHPKTPLDALDYQKRLTFDQLRNTKLKAMSQWKTKDTKGLKKTAYIKDV